MAISMEISEIEAKLKDLQDNWNKASELSRAIKESNPDADTWYNHLKFLASIAHEMAMLDDLRAKKLAEK